MTLDELLGPDQVLPPDFIPTDNGLIFDTSVKDTILAAHDETAQHRIAPVGLTNGNWASSADLLTESDGLLSAVFAALPNGTTALIEVVPWDDVLALLPVPDPEDLP